MHTPLKLYLCLQSYEEFVNAKNRMKQKNVNTVFANRSDIRLIPLDHIAYVHTKIGYTMIGMVYYRCVRCAIHHSWF